MATDAANAARLMLAQDATVAAVEVLVDDAATVERLRSARHASRHEAYNRALEAEIVAEILGGLAEKVRDQEVTEAPQAPPQPQGFELDEALVILLANAGYDSPDAVRDASDEELLAIKGIGRATLAEIRA